jgi:broad specificity phosphatase PhoE
MGLRLIVLRHGSTLWNRERRYQGCVDIRLSDEGRAQAEAVARALADQPFTAVYASPLARAHETASAIATRHQLPVLTAPAFREICMGLWERQTWSEVQAQFPELYAAWLERPHTVAFPEGETLAEVRERMREGLGHLRATHADETICLVSHGIVIHLLLMDALGLPLERLWSIHVSSTGISELEYGDGWPTAHRMNLLSHLVGGAGNSRF